MTHSRRLKIPGVQSWLVCRLGPVAVISIAQLFGTSLWFSANSAADDLMRAWQASASDIGWLTSAVQGGFILGTLAMSLSGWADRFRASRIFVVSALLGSVLNVLFAWFATDIVTGAIFRFAVGFCLAGIYPIGMKLIISWAPERTGIALAQLVAMLTLGTCLPHLLRLVGTNVPWRDVIVASSILALVAAALIWILGDGAHITLVRGSSQRSSGAGRLVNGGSLSAFAQPSFRAAAFGYFGHMWELYAFWTVVPLLLQKSTIPRALNLNVSGLSFLVIGAGALGCLLGGMLSRHVGSSRVATWALAISGACGLVFAVGWRHMQPISLLIVLLIWGAAVIADSPQFSALSAKACSSELIGGALAIQNTIGFAITVVSILTTMSLFQHVGLDATWALVPGPALGLVGFRAVHARSRKDTN
ncbi:MFS transporter [Burkholderia sp. LMG 13014]|uniref:MFS transporter n=1 Tax=Burkholderia sp. LMG 13014 TaxID=2709306 RepID=UPI0019629632|nr:MFS transporter [Burkholderia sp. LMG 13014]